ncbi:oligosaccharide repeat unit polymerase, partial [Enterococcus faecalis]|nr:oligosaccharide repeat unit polymerase [Enterococcus faecalis]
IPLVKWTKAGKDLFNPVTISFFFLIITSVPYLFSIANDVYIIQPQVLREIGIENIPKEIIYFVVILLIGAFSLYFGMKVPMIKKFSNLPGLPKSENRKRYIVGTLLSFFVGMLGYLIFLRGVGGFSVLTSNLNIRTQMTAGNGYLLSLTTTSLTISVVCYIYTFKYKKSFIKYFFLLLLILFVAFLLTSLGGRKQTLQLVTFSLISWHYGVKRVKKIPKKIWLLVPLLVIYIVGIPILRSPDGIETLLNNPKYLASEVKDNIGKSTKEISYIDTYLFITNHFDVSNIWLGSSFKDLLSAPIPSSIMPEKPPVDEGVYIRTLAEGNRNIKPSMPFKELFPSSWPPETIGTMYMNFWIPGVIIGMFLLGKIYKLAYLYMKKCDFNAHSVMIYCYILLNFHLSNLRITQTITSILVISAFFFMILGFSIKKNEKEKRYIVNI